MKNSEPFVNEHKNNAEESKLCETSTFGCRGSISRPNASVECSTRSPPTRVFAALHRSKYKYTLCSSNQMELCAYKTASN